MKYTTLLFDNDDTLMDFGDAERQGIERTFKDNGIPYSEEILKLYSGINLSFWKRFERGEIEKKEIFAGRFAEFSKQTGFPLEPEKLAREYMVNLSYGHKCIDGAKELLESLYGKYDLYIITNGESKTQDRRIADSGLRGYLADVFVSEKTGFQKPNVGYFDYVLSHIREKNRSKILVIGDSPTSDILGGKNAGLDTCWYNPKRMTADCIPTYEIHTLSELYSCL